MSVIVSRALPDVRDGLKPVHRRILYAMHELNFTPDRPYNKSCAHGRRRRWASFIRTGIWRSMTRWCAWRRTSRCARRSSTARAISARSTAIRRRPPATPKRGSTAVALALLEDLDKDTVDFKPNYDEKELEPVVLPARFPNLLVNGAGGIAVGMATNIPPHNLGETIDGLLAMMDQARHHARRADGAHSGARLPDRRRRSSGAPASARPTQPDAARSSCAPRSRSRSCARIARR